MFCYMLTLLITFFSGPSVLFHFAIKAHPQPPYYIFKNSAVKYYFLFDMWVMIAKYLIDFLAVGFLFLLYYIWKGCNISSDKLVSFFICVTLSSTVLQDGRLELRTLFRFLFPLWPRCRQCSVSFTAREKLILYSHLLVLLLFFPSNK